MSVTRIYNPATGNWDLVGLGVQGRPGEPGTSGPEGPPGNPGTQIFYTETPPVGANFGDIWIDKNGFKAVEQITQGLTSERPAPDGENENAFFWSLDEDKLFYSDGAEWHTINDHGYVDQVVGDEMVWVSNALDGKLNSLEGVSESLILNSPRFTSDVELEDVVLDCAAIQGATKSLIVVQGSGEKTVSLLNMIDSGSNLVAKFTLFFEENPDVTWDDPAFLFVDGVEPTWEGSAMLDVMVFRGRATVSAPQVYASS